MVKLHLAVFLFGLAGLFGKFLTLSPTAIVFGRTVVASCALAGCLFQRARWEGVPSRKEFATSAPSGLLLALHWVTFFRAIQVSSVAVGLLSFSTFPVFVALLAPALTGARLTLRDLFTALTVLLGVLFIVPTFQLGDTVVHGVLWGLASGLTFALLTLWNARVVRRMDALQIGFMQNAWAALALTPFAPELTTSSWHDLSLLLFLGLVCTATAHWLFIASLEQVRPQVASVTAGLEPVYGIILAALFLHEYPAARELIGGVLILGAVTFAARAS